MARRIHLRSPLAPVPLARVLEEEMDREWTQAEKNKGRVFGNGTENEINLHVQNWGSRNDFASGLIGTMEADRGETLIKARLGRARSVGCFMVFWFTFLAVFMLVAVGIVTSTSEDWWFSLPFLIIPLIMMGAGVAMLRFGGRNAKEHEERILAFLTEKVQAREVSSHE